MSDLVLSPDMLVDALEMRKQGRSWRAIAAVLGVGEDWLRRRADPGYRARANALWKARNRGPHFVPALDGLGSEPPQRVPLDTRSRFARAMGDPVPGRSALDIKRASSSEAACGAVIHANIHNSHTRLLSRSSEVAQGREPLHHITIERNSQEAI